MLDLLMNVVATSVGKHTHTQTTVTLAHAPWVKYMYPQSLISSLTIPLYTYKPVELTSYFDNLSTCKVFNHFKQLYTNCSWSCIPICIIVTYLKPKLTVFMQFSYILLTGLVKNKFICAKCKRSHKLTVTVKPPIIDPL